jgi:probable HAF family extracellular repeat protein
MDTAGRGLHVLRTTGLPNGAGGVGSRALDINNNDVIVGRSNSLGRDYAVRRQGGQIFNLGTLSGYLDSDAQAINESGQIVGTAYGPNGTSAYLYSGSAMLNLSLLSEVLAAGWTNLRTATDINEAGSIVGTGLKNGQVHSFLLRTASDSAVPSPAPLMLLLLGIWPLREALCARHSS